MAQRTTGFFRQLSSAQNYNIFQSAIGARDCFREYISSYIRPSGGDRILDIGCGTSEILRLLPQNINYTGYDMSDKYIEAAIRIHGQRGRWYCANIRELGVSDAGTFDIVMANGLFHHLDQEESIALSKIAAVALKPSGRFLTIDACYTDNQNPVAHFIISKDRGKEIRRPGEYSAIVGHYFSSTKLSILTDPLRIPYSHAIIEASQPKVVSPSP